MFADMMCICGNFHRYTSIKYRNIASREIGVIKGTTDRRTADPKT